MIHLKRFGTKRQFNFMKRNKILFVVGDKLPVPGLDRLNGSDSVLTYPWVKIITHLQHDIIGHLSVFYNVI